MSVPKTDGSLKFPTLYSVKYSERSVIKLSLFSVRNVSIIVMDHSPLTLTAGSTAVGCRPGLGVATAELGHSLDKSQSPS